MQGTYEEPVSRTEAVSVESVRTTQELHHPPSPMSASTKGVQSGFRSSVPLSMS